MRKITTSTLLALLLLAGTAPESRAQQTNAAASLAPQADSTSCMQHEERPQTVNEMRAPARPYRKTQPLRPARAMVFGGTASYSTHSNDTYRFLVIEGIESKGYTFKVSPMIAYAFRDNMALGGRFIYSRSLLKLDKADLNLGGEDSDLNFELNDCYSLQQSYSVAMIWRQYIPLGRNKRFALFNEMQLSGGGTQARFAKDSPVKGTYQTGYTFSLGISPGYHRLRHEQHGRRGQRRRDGHQLQPHQAGTQPGDGRQARRQHDELQSQYLLDRARHGILSLNTART